MAAPCWRAPQARWVRSSTAEGRAVVLISSDHNELIAMSDRIGIVCGGSIVEVRDAREVNHTHLVQASASKPGKLLAQGD